MQQVLGSSEDAFSRNSFADEIELGILRNTFSIEAVTPDIYTHSTSTSPERSKPFLAVDPKIWCIEQVHDGSI